MKRAFVKNSNYARFMEGVKFAEQRGAREASIVLVTGPAGLGKSETVDRFAVDANALYLRAKETWTRRGLLTEMADSLRLPSSGSNHEVQARIIGQIGVSQMPIVIDEAEFTVRSTASILECVRDVSDLAEVLVVLVGMETMQSRIARYPQLSSRVAQVVRFEPLTQEDVFLTVRQLAEVQVADEVVVALHRQSEGRMRLVMNGIAAIERHAQTNGLEKVTLADMGDISLCHDWQGGRRARVPGGRLS